MNIVYSLISTMVSFGIYALLYFLFVMKWDKETFKEKKLKSGIVVGVLHLVATFLIAFFSKQFLLVGMVMAYVSFFNFCDINIRKTYDVLNYISLVGVLVYTGVNGLFVKQNLLIFAIAFFYILCGYLRVYGSSDGYLLAVLVLTLFNMNCNVFAYPLILLVVSAAASMFCIHIPVYIYNKKKHKQISFWKAKNAFGPAIYIGFMVVVCLHIIGGLSK